MTEPNVTIPKVIGFFVAITVLSLLTSDLIFTYLWSPHAFLFEWGIWVGVEIVLGIFVLGIIIAFSSGIFYSVYKGRR